MPCAKSRSRSSKRFCRENIRVNKSTASVFRKIGSAAVLVAVVLCADLASAEQPQVVLDRGGSTVVLEPYAPNIIRVTLSLQKDPALAAPGFGFVATPSADGWTQPGERQGRYLSFVAPGGYGCEKPSRPSHAHAGGYREVLQWIRSAGAHHDQHAGRQRRFWT